MAGERGEILQYRPRNDDSNNNDSSSARIESSTQLTQTVIASLRRVIDRDYDKPWIGKPEDRNII